MSDIQDNILRDGTSQKFRFNSRPQPENVTVDGRNLEYFLRYIAEFSQQVRFYDRTNFPIGNWNSFFPADTEIGQFLTKLSTGDELPPQLGLFIAFTQLMEILKIDINQLSGKQLQYYFQKVLRFKQQQGLPEKANIIFEPSANLPDPIVLPAGIEMLSGKDILDNQIIFLTDKEFTVSKFAVNKLSSVLVDVIDQSRVYAAPKADSADGLAEPLPKEAPYWNPFGEIQSDKTADERTMIDGKIGFALASPILLLKEGLRTIDITIQCQNYRFSEVHFIAMLNAAVPPIVVDQLRSITGVLYESLAEMEQAIRIAVGDPNFSTHGSAIMDHIIHPFKAITDQELLTAFDVEATGEKDWFPINDVQIGKQADSDLTFQLKLSITEPPIVDYNALVHKQPIDTTLPIIQFSLNHESEDYLYDQLRGLKINNVKISVDVKGVRDIVMQSENGPINPSQPFLPFGAIPAEGSAFHFGSREIFSKKLEKLQLELAWANLPKDPNGFKQYYAGYTPTINANEDFTADFAVLDKKIWLTSGPVILFKSDTSSLPDLPLVRGIFNIDLPLPPLEEETLPEIRTFDTSLQRGFARLTLNSPDFGHTVFPKIYADAALTKVNIPATPLPNTPYTPKISHFALNYKANTEFIASDTAKSNDDRVFHIEPLGLSPMNEDTTGDLFPQFAQGTFYIGLTQLQPPQNISILFQMVDGSANPDIEVLRTDIRWSYFGESKWVNFSDVAIQLDTSFGLQTSGVIEFSVGRDASDKAAFWANGLFWLKAEFSKHPSGASKVASIFSNAIVATLRQLPGDGILTEPISPGSISKLLTTDARIKSISQPFASFGGKPIEPLNDFNRRVSERLRHKNRAVNLWDYENLVLQAFPSIYKVKCLPHTGRSIEAEPGSVTLLVIPDLRKRNKINPFEPKVSAVLRNQIRDHIVDLNSGVATVHVDNPVYEQVYVEMSVGLLPGFDGNFYGRLLNEELKRFLSPWAFEEGRDIVFGGKIFKSSILSFVEQREYVDYVTNFRLYHLNSGPGIGSMRVREDLFETPQDFIVRADTIGEEIDFEIVASSPKSILVTAQDHTIKVLNPGEFACPGNALGIGIEAMIIEVDFFVF